MPMSHQPERAGLREFLDYQREALIAKVQDLTDQQARLTPTVSSLSLLSLVKHSAIWERRWFQIIVAGRSFPDEWPEVQSAQADPTFQLSDDDTIESVVADYRAQIVVSNVILDSFDLDVPCAWPDMADQTLRVSAGNHLCCSAARPHRPMARRHHEHQRLPHRRRHPLTHTNFPAGKSRWRGASRSESLPDDVSRCQSIRRRRGWLRSDPWLRPGPLPCPSRAVDPLLRVTETASRSTCAWRHPAMRRW